jgi:hypothetical protein
MTSDPGVSAQAIDGHVGARSAPQNQTEAFTADIERLI